MIKPGSRARGRAGVDAVVRAAPTPIRLQVIPYQVNKKALPALLAPPPMITDQALPRNEGLYRAEVGTATITFDWLMD